MITKSMTLIEQAKAVHTEATQQKLAASDASHPLRNSHSASALAADANRNFQNIGQTLVPELLRELEEANRLLARRAGTSSMWDAEQMEAIITLAHENGWNGVENSKLLSGFFRNLVNDLRIRAEEVTVKKTVTFTIDASKLIDEWCGGSDSLRYAEVSRGRRAKFMVTLWQIDHVTAEDVKVGHGEGETLEEAFQRAQGVIIL